MPEQRIAQLESEVRELRAILSMLVYSDRYIFSRDIEMQAGRNMQLSTSGGTRFGTGTTQLLAFYNSLPIVQPSAVTSAASQGPSYVQADVQTIATAVNDLLTRLRNLGLIAT